MIERAYGKINLSLNITGVREDGYHTLESIFLPLNFYDEITINKSEKMEYKSSQSFIRFNESNTIVKAVELMKKEFSIEDNFSIYLNKHLPMQAGLAGGSTDGAAVIRAINKMYNLNLSDEKIKELCLSIGADVLFTYYNKPAYVTGIGDEIKFIDVKEDYYVLIVKPKFGVSTKDCYNLMNCETCPHPDIKGLEKALETGEDFMPYLGNSMEPAAIELLNSIADVKKAMLDAGAPFALMSGSGSSVFTMSKDLDTINQLYEALHNKGWFVRHTKILKMG